MGSREQGGKRRKKINAKALRRKGAKQEKEVGREKIERVAGIRQLVVGGKAKKQGKSVPEKHEIFAKNEEVQMFIK